MDDRIGAQGYGQRVYEKSGRAPEISHGLSLAHKSEDSRRIGAVLVLEKTQMKRYCAGKEKEPPN